MHVPGGYFFDALFIDTFQELSTTVRGGQDCGLFQILQKRIMQITITKTGVHFRRKL